MLLDSDKIRIQHMIEAATEALEYAHGRSSDELRQERPLQHLLVRDLEILGEAASRVSVELRTSHPEIPWRDMVAMRNRLIHAYFDTDLDIVLRTVHSALPGLLGDLQKLMKQLEAR